MTPTGIVLLLSNPAKQLITHVAYFEPCPAAGLSLLTWQRREAERMLARATLRAYASDDLADNVSSETAARVLCDLRRQGWTVQEILLGHPSPVGRRRWICTNCQQRIILETIAAPPDDTTTCDICGATGQFQAMT